MGYVADTQPYRARKRGSETATDMARSLIPVTILILLFVAFCAPKGGDPVRVVDTSDDIRSAAEFLDFPLPAPSGLAKQWRPTSSGLLRDSTAVGAAPVGLSIGYVTPKDTFARYSVRQGTPSVVLRQSVDSADIRDNPSGPTVEIGGRTWTPFTTSGGRGYYSATGTGSSSVVLVVAGGAADAELRTLAGSLRVVEKQ